MSDFYFQPFNGETEEQMVKWAIKAMQDLEVDYVKVEKINDIPCLLFTGVKDHLAVKDWLTKAFFTQ